MADLITNLQSIYNTKLQIKEAIGTDSDIFSDYPTYISDLKPSGYTYITANGDYDVSAYSDVNVHVSGGSAVLGGLSVTENGQYSATSYAYDGFDVVNVNVPVPQYVFGYQDITTNGTTYASTFGFDGFTYVNVNVPTGGSSIHDGLTPYTAFTVDELISYMKANYNPGDPQTPNALYVKGKIANVIYTFSAQYPSWRGYLTNDGTFYYETENPSNYDLLKDLYVYGCYWESTQSQLWDSSVTPQVAVGDEVIILAPVAINSNGRVGTQNGYLYSHQKPVTGQLTVSQSGTYDVQNYVSAYVNVSGGGTPTLNVSGQYGIYNGKYYIYDQNLMTYLTLSGPITNVGLGDTVSGTVEYSDIDGTGMYGSYICKNFSGTNTQDSGRVYTSLSVNNYYWSSTSIVNTVSGSISSSYYSLEGGAAMTYYLPSDYSGSTIESGSTVYCYVSEGYPMMMNQYWINEVVNVVTPVLTGASYSTDGGMTWNAMSSDVMINGYSVDNLGRSVPSMSGDYLHIRLEYDNGASYKYITNYVSIDSGSMSPYSSMIQKDSMIMSMTIYNNAGFNIEVSKIGVTNDTVYVYWAQGVTYGYRVVATDSTGVPTGSTYDMMSDPAMFRYKYHWSENDNVQYFYIQKYVISGSGTDENYKPSGEVEFMIDDTVSVSTSNTGFFKRGEDIRFWIYFNYNASTVSSEGDEYLRLEAGGSELLLVYEMGSGGNRLTTAGVTGCSFFDMNDDEYKPAVNTTISSGYDGSLNITTSGTGTLDFGAGTFMMYYYDDPMGGKNVYIHDETPA